MHTPASTTISLGKPITAPVLVPVEHKSSPMCINFPFVAGGESYKVTAMSFGSPHGAVFLGEQSAEGGELDGFDVEKIGSLLGTYALFPEGASIVFIEMVGNMNLKARVWQRGEGEVAFTPEAACVAGTAAMMLQKTPGYEVDVTMGGDTYRVKWNRSGGDVTITGESKLVTGE